METEIFNFSFYGILNFHFVVRSVIIFVFSCATVLSVQWKIQEFLELLFLSFFFFIIFTIYIFIILFSYNIYCKRILARKFPRESSKGITSIWTHEMFVWSWKGNVCHRVGRVKTQKLANSNFTFTFPAIFAETSFNHSFAVTKYTLTNNREPM